MLGEIEASLGRGLTSDELAQASTEKGYVNVSIEDGRALGLVRAHGRLVFDAFNPRDEPISLQLSVRDPKSTSYNTRYNGSVSIAAGTSAVEIDYTRLPRSGSAPGKEPDLVDPGRITSIVLFLMPHKDGPPITLYIDNFRLAPAK